MNLFSRYVTVCFVVLFTALLAGCQAKPVKIDAGVKNIILMIGDGMGPQQLGLLREYARRAEHSVYKDQQGETAFDYFAQDGFVGLSSHGPADALVTDSACSASQLAGGVSSGSEMIGLDQDGNQVETILERAKKLGKATGLVSDTRITHATPAAFASHQRHRSLENEIAWEMLDSGNVDVMLSGGLRHWLPESVNSDPIRREEIKQLIVEPSMALASKRNDNMDLLANAKAWGYGFAFNSEQLQAAQSDKLLGLFASSGMLDGVAYHQEGSGSQPSLAQMTAKALGVLGKNPEGFFLMVEGGQIDWAGHNNDAGTLLHEMIKLEEAVSAVYDWVKGRDDTLVIITADHETGGFGFSYSRYDLPEPKTLSGELFEGHQYQPRFNFGKPEILDRLYAQKKSFYNMWRLAQNGKDLPDAGDLMRVINDNSDFKIDIEQADHILRQEKNEYRVDGHPQLKDEYFPKVHDFKEFYVYGRDVHLDLIGRELAKEQNIVWATGTHTHTPVPVIAWGPENYAKRFSTLSHHTDVGRWMMDLWSEK